MNFQTALKVNLFWRVVQCVVRGIGVATQLSAKELASLWGVEAENVFSYLHSLRSMGYEVRNHNTNTQITKGEYLIPYAFPTLTPRKVQLRKNLGTTTESLSQKRGDIAPIDEPCYQWLSSLKIILANV